MLKAKPTIFLFPFAGGNSSSYSVISNQLSCTYTVVATELPGRGSLSRYKPLEDIDSLVDYLFNTVIKPKITDEKYFLYGHSMGGLIAYLLAYKISATSIQLPKHIIISGKSHPSCKTKSPLANLDSDIFWQEITKMGGTPNNLLLHQQLKDYFEPILRQDFKLIEKYNFIKPQKRLKVPMTIMYGEQDNMSLESIYRWQEENEEKINFIGMRGSHFFIFENVKRVTDYLISIA
ncbi:thioesterase II family protein [Gilliamella sp. Fer4-1]|uniref:thioesterase II family protein n=1 Tax=Gilliamella sp. Fer4-1 TaxID=3120242 RepID=UPI00080DF626|nr:alpha/beta fold hydrolase [Gilliamella apicola]OCG61567.1 hypothetical protein A9G30_10280 [Gilliamella apicola]